MDVNYKIKERLNEALKVRGMTAAELAAKSGLNRSSVSRYLSGENIPRSPAIGKMAEALGVSPAWLLGYDLTMDGEEVTRVELDKLTEGNRARLLAYYQALLDAQKGEDDGHA